MFAGLVLPAAAGNFSALHQHLSGHHVLQAAHVASACGACAPFLPDAINDTFVNICNF